MAERLGFEPRVPLGDTAFRVLHHRPLGHLSIFGQQKQYNAFGQKKQVRICGISQIPRKSEKNRRRSAEQSASKTPPTVSALASNQRSVRSIFEPQQPVTGANAP